MASPSTNRGAVIGQIIGGRYEVLRLIGQGGMGSVYEVRNIRLGRSFAMKTLTSTAAANPQTLQRFRREADVIAKIKHPNIVEIVDWESLDDGSPAIVMANLRGEDLARRIAGAPMAWPQLARIADEMLAALSVAHASGVVHRDLKPENVFLAVDDAGGERVKLLDFGVSKVRDSKSLVTSDDHLLGTPAYMSPEQADGRPDDIGPHSDVWAVGALLHEMATGHVAFTAPSVPSVLYMICHKSPASVLEGRPDAPAAFVELVAAALDRDISRRIPDANVMRARLRDALRDVDGVRFVDALPASAVAPPPPEKTSSLDVASPSLLARRRLAPVALAVGSFAIAAIVVAIGVAAWSKPRAVRPVAAPVAMPREEATASPDAAVAAMVTPAVDAAAAMAAQAPPEPARARTPQVHTPLEPRHVDASTAQPVKAEAAKAEVPAAPPKKKACAKDDVECLYGDGT